MGIEIHDLTIFESLKTRKMWIFGAGGLGEQICNKLKNQIKLLGFIDNDPLKRKMNICGLSVFSLDEAKIDGTDMVLISASFKKHKDEIINQLKNHNIKNENIFYFTNHDKFYYSNEFYMTMEKKETVECYNNMASIVLQFLGKVNSVIDLGCGNGLWLSILNEKYRVEEILGVDGEYAKESLKINPDNFMPYDLTKPLDLNRKFDLAMAIEVAEHLPEECADTFVDSLCNHSDIILFSAAVPGQTGANHINCQYPSWWAKLFNKKGYSCVDVLRGKFLHNGKISFYYKQNMMFYIKDGSQIMRDFIKRNISSLWNPPLDVIHPFSLMIEE